MTRARCHPDRHHKGRGLCVPCYTHAQRAGTLHTLPSVQVERRERVLDSFAAGRAAGLVNKQIARRVGLTPDGLKSAVRTARRAGDPRAHTRRAAA